ncbi:OmpA family protein [Trinickia violacea]|uniref:OmpA family protein n=1 Tax=Trinickia violacea TaxID=2571746 RepID=A0A4P8J2I8_9BURK|nr:OmpA family protein [Trinickia violacea]QCP55116.1 OmpA family protein [Trinickia violacea]
MKANLACALALAGLLASPAFASVRSQADALMPAAQAIADPYQRGQAEGWLEIAARQDGQVLVSHTYNDAAPKALQNARHFIDGSVPFAPIYGEKHWPTRENWVKAIREIEAVNERASASTCKGESAGRLSALTDEVWKEQDETHGTRWVHGWAQIERAKRLSETVDAELAQCSAPAAPVAQAVPAAPPKAIELSADATFGFDSAMLKPQGRAAIDALAKSIADAGKADVITVTGYTDRLGSTAHNLELSRRRAQTVADALKADGVQASRIEARGAGAASPVVSCPGARSARVIACLAPNRRVEVRVSGTAAHANAGQD